MIIDIVGYTGFVGSNLSLTYNFDHAYNSKNVESGYNSSPDILVYAGVTGTKYIANKFPEQDQHIIDSAIKNIYNFKAKKLVLISTIDVYEKPDGLNEDDDPTSSVDFTYGFHRKQLENWVKSNIENFLIVRLPGIYGRNIRKNFIFDIINPIPQALSESLYNNFSKQESIIGNAYIYGNDSFYHPLENINQDELLKAFDRVGFSSLYFTDSRGLFQYYNLKYLWNHINIALQNNVKVLNIATEPFFVSELYEYLFNKKFNNEFSNNIPYYNFKTKYTSLFGGQNGYIFSKEQVMKDISQFIEDYKSIKF